MTRIKLSSMPWRRRGFFAVLCALTALCSLAAAAGPTVSALNPKGAAGRTQAPVFDDVHLDDSLLSAALENRLELREVGAASGSPSIPAQFEEQRGPFGILCWLMPEGKAGMREFEVVVASERSSPVMEIKVDEQQRYIFFDQEKPVLTYNFGTVPVPEGVTGKYAVARSDYVHPIYGPGGVELTKDFSPDHPHHRGIYWAWPEVEYNGEKRDLHALQGVFARPVAIANQSQGPILAKLIAENVWKWGDSEPIVKEYVEIRVYRATAGIHFIDFKFDFIALKEGVTLARRGTDKYGGFNVRLSERKEQEIIMFTDPSTKRVRKSWAELSGIPPGIEEVIGVTILQSTDNPEYPGDWQPYEDLNWLQPTFPSKKTRYALSTDTSLRLQFRLVIHPGRSDEKRLADYWEAYQIKNRSKRKKLSAKSPDSSEKN